VRDRERESKQYASPLEDCFSRLGSERVERREREGEREREGGGEGE